MHYMRLHMVEENIGATYQFSVVCVLGGIEFLCSLGPTHIWPNRFYLIAEDAELAGKKNFFC
jgi:hypothetical protein